MTTSPDDSYTLLDDRTVSFRADTLEEILATMPELADGKFEGLPCRMDLHILGRGGRIVISEAEVDEDGNITTEAVYKDGFHVDVLVDDPECVSYFDGNPYVIPRPVFRRHRF